MRSPKRLAAASLPAYVAATVCPVSRNATEIASPMPRVPPVTIATCPTISPSCQSGRTPAKSSIGRTLTPAGADPAASDTKPPSRSPIRQLTGQASRPAGQSRSTHIAMPIPPPMQSVAEPLLRVATAHLVEQRGQHPRAGGAHRMPQRDSRPPFTLTLPVSQPSPCSPRTPARRTPRSPRRDRGRRRSTPPSPARGGWPGSARSP